MFKSIIIASPRSLVPAFLQFVVLYFNLKRGIKTLMPPRILIVFVKQHPSFFTVFAIFAVPAPGKGSNGSPT